jgi:hypothetical protein
LNCGKNKGERRRKNSENEGQKERKWEEMNSE